MTYRTFAPPEQLLHQLIARYTTPTALMHAKDHNLVKMRYSLPSTATTHTLLTSAHTTHDTRHAQGV
jgi:hypothetical protein